MATTTTQLPVGAARAFQLLEDPRSLRQLVVGARKIRRFDPRWPEVGSALHHSVGFAPFIVRDTTVVTQSTPGARLVLEARVQAAGVLVVAFDFEDHPDGCTLTVREHPERGPLSWPGLRLVAEWAIGVRNLELCRRYRRLVERRERLAAAVTSGG